MIQIRNNVFETNSSSSHSIIITNNDCYNEKVDPDYHLNQDGIYNIWDPDKLDFGRYPFDILIDCWDKIRYSIAYYNEGKFQEIVDLCKKHINGFKGIKLPRPDWDDDVEEYYGHVDHQSSDLLNKLLRRGITLEQFIFNDRYIVIIDGDEYCIFDKFLDKNLINKYNVEEIIGSY